MVKNVAVYCASADGIDLRYRAAAVELGAGLAARGMGLVYGGANVGLMQAVADAVLADGGRVAGVIPEVLVGLEVAHRELTELHVVDTMHTRKAMMMQLADAFVVLPGGFGTLEELFEVLTWQMLKLHTKPVLLLNLGGYYKQLLGFLDHAVEQGMLKPASLELLQVISSVAEVFERLGAMEPASSRADSM